MPQLKWVRPLSVRTETPKGGVVVRDPTASIVKAQAKLVKKVAKLMN